MSIQKVLIVLCISLVLSGCASSLKMGLVKGQDAIDVTKESIALVTVRISNQNSPNCQPKLVDFYYSDAAVGSTAQRVGLDDPFKSEPEKYNEHLVKT